MADQMHATTGLANDRFQNFGLVRNVRIAGGAALDGSAVSEEARGHAAKLATPSSNHGSPCGAGAARSRRQHNGRTGPALAVIDAPTRYLDHLLNPYSQMRSASASKPSRRSTRTTQWSGRSTARPEVAPSRSLSACQSVDVGGGQGVATDPPVAAFHLLDDAPRDVAHVLALDRDHRVGQLADDLALLFLTEYVLDDANLNERH